MSLLAGAGVLYPCWAHVFTKRHMPNGTCWEAARAGRDDGGPELSPSAHYPAEIFKIIKKYLDIPTPDEGEISVHEAWAVEPGRCQQCAVAR
jgi:hypothetical protein